MSFETELDCTFLGVATLKSLIGVNDLLWESD